MQFSNDKDVCLCPSIIHPFGSPSSSQSLVKDVCSKYYQEIGAEMISNQLIIRLEKDKNKSKRKQKEWDPPCDCVEIQRPTSKTGPKIINADYDDRIVFRVHSAFHFGKEDPYKSQTIAYKIGSCEDGQDNHQCKTITVYPQFSTGTQEVYSDHIKENDQDIFLLRIKKKAENPEQKNRNVELEVRTPKPPVPLSPLPEPVSAVVPPQIDTDVDEKDKKKPDVIEEITKQPTTVKGRKRKEKKKKE